MQGIAGRCHALINAERKVHVNMATTQIEKSNSEKLLKVPVHMTVNLVLRSI